MLIPFPYPLVITVATGGPSWTDVLTAIGTGVLALFAIITAIVAGRALRAQSEQLKIERGERSREADERRRAQAVQVFITQVKATRGPGPGEEPHEVVTAWLHNTSRQPVFDVCFRWRHGAALSLSFHRVEPLLPTTEVMEEETVPSGVLSRDFGATAHFRDRAGLWWRVHPDGRLDGPAEGKAPDDW